MSITDDRTEARSGGADGSADDLFDKIRDNPVGESMFRSPRRRSPRDAAVLSRT